MDLYLQFYKIIFAAKKNETIKTFIDMFKLSIDKI